MIRNVLAMLATLCFHAVVFAQLSHSADYPTKTVQIVNPFPPGALTDMIARLIAEKLSVSLGQSTIVINKTGGGGAIGIKAVKDAPADGYTLLIAPPPLVLIPLARKNIGFALSDFTPVNLIGNTPSALIVKADRPGKASNRWSPTPRKSPAHLPLAVPAPAPWVISLWSCSSARPASIENRGPEETAKILAAFNQKWTEVAKNAKIVAE